MHARLQKRLTPKKVDDSGRRRFYLEAQKQDQLRVVQSLRSELLGSLGEPQVKPSYSKATEALSFYQTIPVYGEASEGPPSVASFFQIPETLVDFPEDMNRYLCCLRPAGHVCHLLVHGKLATLRKSDGRIVRRFRTQLPHGTVLVCVMADAEVLVLDALAWKGVVILDMPAEHRLVFLGGRVEDFRLDHPTDHVTMVTYQFTTSAVVEQLVGLAQAPHRDPELLQYTPDGMLFVHAESFHLPGCSPICLLWRTPELSEWFVDDPSGSGVPDLQSARLALELQTGELRAADETAVCRLQDGQLAAARQKCGKATGTAFVRVTFSDLTFAPVALQDAQLESVCKGGRRALENKVSSVNRLVQQYLARRHVLLGEDYLLSVSRLLEELRARSL
ncbi:MAG: hypothetical protein KVP17_000130 [Porospora cf. gigantea B]|uniref:uncharacterized protein n=1 Tax=Porospora cf. gigantea B TaxID=2853592 RepID=UPI003571B74A|nr:MAG: hypothetical protein KVP17_000130 [Porospora cf. gigantea B]